MGLNGGPAFEVFPNEDIPGVCFSCKMRSWACFSVEANAFELKVSGQRALTIRRNHGRKPTSALGKVNSFLLSGA